MRSSFKASEGRLGLGFKKRSFSSKTKMVRAVKPCSTTPAGMPSAIHDGVVQASRLIQAFSILFRPWCFVS